MNSLHTPPTADADAAKPAAFGFRQATAWPNGQLHRVPFWLYSDPALLAQEQDCIFRGATWNYLCLAAELPEVGSYRTTFIGETPVVVTRGKDGEISAFENRCAHRGALIALEKSGRTKSFQCVYHAWGYDLRGNLTGVAFERGIKGLGGMPAGFDKTKHGPRRLKVAVLSGLVFGSFSPDAPDITGYLGETLVKRIERVMGEPVEVIGRFTQTLPNNWKLYVENVKDSYHASLLHTFFTTFGLNRLSQKGGVIVDESGAHHVSYSMMNPDAKEDLAYKGEALRSDNDRYRLKDLSVLSSFKEFDDGITLQILSVFPGFVLQQIQNCIAIRQVIPQGMDQTQLNWVYLGRVSDTPEQRTARLKQCNLVGPAGYVSMEDGAVGGFVQRGTAAASQLSAVVEMGGHDVESCEGRATETSVRGFWKAYRHHMGI